LVIPITNNCITQIKDDNMNKLTALKERHTISEAMTCSTVLRVKDKVIVTEEFKCLANIKMVDRMMVSLARSKGPLFTVKDFPKKEGQYAHQTDLGREFLTCFSIDFEIIKQIYPDNIFSPYFSLFEQHISDLNLGYGRLLPEQVPGLNKLVDQIRGEAISDGFTKVLANHERASKKNGRSLVVYLDAIRKSYSKLLVVRLDLHYGKHFVNPQDDLGCVTRAEAKRHREEFIKHLKKCYPVVGYVWKTERGAIKSFHHHFLLMFNGQNLRADETIGMRLGEHWVREITRGIGTYWNCNAKKGEYSNLAIGTIHHDDNVTWALLNQIAMYLTKIDMYVKDNAPEHDRCFGKGTIPKTEGKRKGRPRVKVAA